MGSGARTRRRPTRAATPTDERASGPRASRREAGARGVVFGGGRCGGRGEGGGKGTVVTTVRVPSLCLRDGTSPCVLGPCSVREKDRGRRD